MAETSAVKNERVYAHIVCDHTFDGWARLDGHRIRVMDIVLAYQHSGKVEAVLDDYPQLGHGQVHAALAYFYDHREEIERQIALSEEQWEQGRATQKLPPSLREGFEDCRPSR